MYHTFFGCENLTNLNLSSFKTENLLNMQSMFAGYKNLLDINLSSFDTSSVENMTGLFEYCEKLSEINIDNFILRLIILLNLEKSFQILKI